jgi:hypothetical protein
VSLEAVDDFGHSSDATETSEDSAIEKVIKLAKQYAAGTPPEKEFKALKQRLAAAIKGTELRGVSAPPLAPLVPIGGEARCNSPARPDIGRYLFEAHEGGSDFSARLRVMEKSIRLFPRSSDFKNDQLASDRSSTGRRAVRSLVYVCFAALIGAGCKLCWSHYDEAKDVARAWGQTLSFLSIATTKPQRASLPAAAATPPVSAQRPVPISPDPSGARFTTEEVGAEKKLMPDTVLTTLPATKRDARPNIASPPFNHAKLTSNPEARPTTIKGWTLHDVADGTALLEGPRGIWRVKRGDPLPGVGRIESIVRWGNRWIVVTSSGLISTP